MPPPPGFGARSQSRRPSTMASITTAHQQAVHRLQLRDDRCYDGHTGTDYAVPLGTNVMAPADGVVVATNDGCANYGGLGNTCGGSCGNYVKLELPDGNFILFCHFQNGSLQVSTGDHVTCGQIVGKSASSGNSSGPHLHMAWRNSGNTGMNPYKGSCSSSAGAWVDQGGYWDPTGDQCECVSGTEVCNGQDDDCDGQVDEDEVCEREALLRGQSWLAPRAHHRHRRRRQGGRVRTRRCRRVVPPFARNLLGRQGACARHLRRERLERPDQLGHDPNGRHRRRWSCRSVRPLQRLGRLLEVRRLQPCHASRRPCLVRRQRLGSVPIPQHDATRGHRRRWQG